MGYGGSGIGIIHGPVVANCWEVAANLHVPIVHIRLVTRGRRDVSTIIPSLTRAEVGREECEHVDSVITEIVPNGVALLLISVAVEVRSGDDPVAVRGLVVGVAE